MIKRCVPFNPIVLDTLKNDCDIKERNFLPFISQSFSFLFLKDKSVTQALIFLLVSISAIISPNTIKTFLFFVGLLSSKFWPTLSAFC